MTVSADIADAAHVRPQLTQPTDPALSLTFAVALVLLVHGYLVGLWTDVHGERFWLVDLIRTWVARPLGLGEDLGPLGVMLLLAATGYSLAAGARVLAILVPAAAAAGLTFALAGHGALSSGPTILAWVVLLALAGRAATAITDLIPERRQWTWYLAQLVLVVDLVALAEITPALQPAAAVAAFYPLVVIGQLIHAVRGGGLPAWAGGSLGFASYAVVVIADRTVPALDGWWYPLAASYAALLFATAVTFAGRTAAQVAAHPVARWAAHRTWWYLLFIGPVAHPALTALHTVLPTWVAVALAVIGTAVVVEAGCRLARFFAAIVTRRVTS
ncbi:MAG: hypothetical protein ACRDQ7_03190 [Haloechinothrix sp.]